MFAMSPLLDAGLRKANDVCNPASQKKRSDGIDLDLYCYLVPPAFVVVEESRFHTRVEDIRSPQHC